MEVKTLEVAFTVVRPEVSHFCIFSCPIYVHIPVEKRTELEPSSRKVLFVGYSETSMITRFLSQSRESSYNMN